MVSETEYSAILAQARANPSKFYRDYDFQTDPASGAPEPGHPGPVVSYFVGGFGGMQINVRYNARVGVGPATVTRIGDDTDITPADLEKLKEDQPRFYAYLEAVGSVAPLPPGYIGRTDQGELIPDQTEINRQDRLLRQEISDDFSYFQGVFSRSASVTPETLNDADKARFERLLRNLGATEYSGEPLQADGVYTDGTRMAISSIEAVLRDELPHAGIRIGGGLSNAEARALFAVDSIDAGHGLDRFQRIAGTALLPPDF